MPTQQIILQNTPPPPKKIEGVLPIQVSPTPRSPGPFALQYPTPSPDGMPSFRELIPLPMTTPSFRVSRQHRSGGSREGRRSRGQMRHVPSAAHNVPVPGFVRRRARRRSGGGALRRSFLLGRVCVVLFLVSFWNCPLLRAGLEASGG